MKKDACDGFEIQLLELVFNVGITILKVKLLFVILIDIRLILFASIGGTFEKLRPQIVAFFF